MAEPNESDPPVNFIRPDDKSWVESLVARGEFRGRLRDVTVIRSGAVFVSGRAHHIQTRKSVYLTFARPGDADALDQLGICREVFAGAKDERIGTVIDSYWAPNSASLAWGCLASTWHEGLVTFEHALTSSPKTIRAELVLSWLRSVCRQLQKIHVAGFAHGDLSMSNLAVDEAQQIHIIDFEHAVSPQTARRARLGHTIGYVHPRKSSLGSADSITIADHQAWDRYALGQVFLSALGNCTPKVVVGLTPRIQRGIRLMGALLLDGENTEAELALGLGREFFVEEKLRSLDGVIWGIDQLTGRWSLSLSVPELQPSTGAVIEVGLNEPVAFTTRVERLMSTREMSFLYSLQQLGLISFIWPGAVHNRASHSLGVMGIAAKAIVSLASDPENPLFSVIVTPRRARELLLAALLHDVGHYPLAHDLEEAHRLYFEHETRSKRIIQNGAIARAIRDPEESDGWDASPANVVSILEGKPLAGSTEIGRFSCSLFHSLISGPIDADKLDYLARDSHALNVKAGSGLDIERILSSLTVAVISDAPSGTRLAVRAKGRRPAELVGRVRSHMFGVAYWHHAYRAIKCIVKWLVWEAFETEGRAGRSSRVVVRDFFAFIDELSAWVIPLESGTEDAENALLPEASGRSLQLVRSGCIPQVDAQALNWFVEKGSSRSRELMKLLVTHNWVRPVLTIPYPAESDTSVGEIDAKLAVRLWDAFSDLHQMEPEKHWRALMEVGRALQTGVIEWLAGSAQGNAGTYVVDYTATRKGFVDFALTNVVFLLDGPDISKASQNQLYWSLGDRKADITVDVSRSIPLSRSVDDDYLRQGFVKANGLLCIYCHPGYSSFIQSAISQATLAGLVENAIATAIPVRGSRRSRKA